VVVAVAVGVLLGVGVTVGVWVTVGVGVYPRLMIPSTRLQAPNKAEAALKASNRLIHFRIAIA
jgi:hypothetical protein